MPKKVLIALPPGLLEQVDFVAKVEHRTRSDLIRESLRRYLENFKQKSPARPVNVITEVHSQTPALPPSRFESRN